jgi:hypothetical protein
MPVKNSPPILGLRTEARVRWRAWWQATKRLKRDPWSALDTRLLTLTLLNALLYWPWHWLRVAFDAGNHYPLIVLGMMLLTLWLWSELVKAVVDRFKGVKRNSRGR